MNLMQQFSERLAQLPDFLCGHILLSYAALAVGLGMSLPLGVLASRRVRLAEWTLTAAGVIQTVPSLALLALLVPVLGGIGFAPSFVALTLYSVLPILANTITGVRGVDPALVNAASGLGMNERQLLFRVQLPLAAPVIIAGIRTATVLVVGTATLATPVGGTTLGNYIFQGLSSLNYFSTVFGCVLAAGLAVLMDQLVHLLELALLRRSPRLGWASILGLAAVFGVGLWGPAARAVDAAEHGRSRERVVIATAPFTEQDILSELLADRLAGAGFRPEQRKGVEESIIFEALFGDEIDCCVEYTGNVWALVMKRSDVADRATTLDEVTQFLRERHGVVCLGSLGFENAYALAMPRRRADERGIRSIADLASHAPSWKIGGDEMIFGRPEWVRVRDTYGLRFSRQVAMDDTLMYSAVDQGSVDVIVAYTSDGRIKAYDLQILEDPQQAFPPYDAVLLLSKRGAERPRVADSLRSLVGAIDLDAMQEANRRVDVEKQSPRNATRALINSINSR
jgi:osmoprotectant transport system permease protein